MECIQSGDRAMVEARHGWRLMERRSGLWITVGTVETGQQAEDWIHRSRTPNPEISDEGVDGGGGARVR